MWVSGLFEDLLSWEHTPQLNPQQVQGILRLCRELLTAEASGTLRPDMRTTAVEQLTLLRNQLRHSKVTLTGNACRDLNGGRRKPLDDGLRAKAVTSLIGLLTKAADELEGVPALHIYDEGSQCTTARE